MTIKSFIYLDDYKLYSIASQVFEGMTEYIIKSRSNSIEENTEQKGELGSGKLMADLIKDEKNETQKIFLHDHLFSLLEQKLIELNKVLIADQKQDSLLSELPNATFVKISGRVVFNDTESIENTISTFNDLGLAFASVTNVDLLELQSNLNTAANNSKDRNQKNQTQNQKKVKENEIKEIAKSKGLYLNDEYLKNLRYLVNYGYHGQFEIQMPYNIYESQILFSSVIKREKLKVEESLIIKRYGRISEKKFTVFGILTQSSNDAEKLKIFPEGLDGMKPAINTVVEHLTNMENKFIGKIANEYVIDPIAIYHEF